MVTPSPFSRHDGVVTLWYVTTEQPAAIIATHPRADRGFGRKLLAQLNPRWPITVIGQFDLNRSAPASESEYYIAGFPGVSVLQTYLPEATRLTELPSFLLEALPAENVYAFVRNTETSLGGFAHWRKGKLRRSFSAKLQRVYEDIGLPEPFEQPYWAGEHKGEQTGSSIALPFNPIDLVNAAELHWTGYSHRGNTDLNVVGYAIDGRPEPKLEKSKLRDISWIAEQASSKLNLGENRRAYDDYESYEQRPEVTDNVAKIAQNSAAAVKKLGSGSKKLGKRTWQQIRSWSRQVGENIRHIDRS